MVGYLCARVGATEPDAQAAMASTFSSQSPLAVSTGEAVVVPNWMGSVRGAIAKQARRH